MKSPIKWFGGKGHMIRKLLSLLPENYIELFFIESFGGAYSLTLAKHPSKVEVYNDIDGGLVHFFSVLRDPDSFDAFYRKCCMTPYSREIYNDFRHSWIDYNDPIERAYRWFVTARMSFSGRFGQSWGFCVSASHQGMSGAVSTWLSCIDRLPEIHQRLMRVQIECQDWRQVFDTYDTPNSFFYLDPPYVHKTRRDARYAHEMTDDDHIELVERLHTLKGKWLLSGYDNPLYQPLSNKYHRIDWKTACHAAGRTRFTGILGEGSAIEKASRVETVWMNYETQLSLF